MWTVEIIYSILFLSPIGIWGSHLMAPSAGLVSSKYHLPLYSSGLRQSLAYMWSSYPVSGRIRSEPALFAKTQSLIFGTWYGYYNIGLLWASLMLQVLVFIPFSSDSEKTYLDGLGLCLRTTEARKSQGLGMDHLSWVQLNGKVQSTVPAVRDLLSLMFPIPT